jgi:quinol monooxygenase YgiN
MTGYQVDNGCCDLPGGDHLDYREGMTQTCTVMVPLQPLEGRVEKVVGILDEVIPAIVAGPGCLRYELFQEVTGRLVLWEEWESRVAWQAHFEWEPIKRLKRELAELVEMPVERWEMYPRLQS